MFFAADLLGTIRAYLVQLYNMMFLPRTYFVQLRTFQPNDGVNFKNTKLKQKFTGSYIKKLHLAVFGERKNV